MTDDTGSTQEKVRENRLRRMAERRGLTLSKSRRRDTGALDYGLWTVTPGSTISGLAGDRLPTQTMTFRTLDSVEAFLDPNFKAGEDR